MTTMDGIKDFRVPLYMDIAQSEQRSSSGICSDANARRPEDVSGNFIFLDDGTDCCVKFPTAKKRRVEIRTEWNGRVSRYHDIFESMLYYVHEELLEDFVDFMKGGSDDASGDSLNGLRRV